MSGISQDRITRPSLLRLCSSWQVRYVYVADTITAMFQAVKLHIKFQAVKLHIKFYAVKLQILSVSMSETSKRQRVPKPKRGTFTMLIRD